MRIFNVGRFSISMGAGDGDLYITPTIAIHIEQYDRIVYLAWLNFSINFYFEWA
jgi:hypothetical protein